MCEPDIEDLYKLRKKLFKYIKKALMEDYPHKGSEGAFSIHLPNYFEDMEEKSGYGNHWGLSLYCYVFGPNRHYTWYGKTLDECIKKAKKDIDSWCKEFDKEL